MAAAFPSSETEGQPLLGEALDLLPSPLPSPSPAATPTAATTTSAVFEDQEESSQPGLIPQRWLRRLATPRGFLILFMAFASSQSMITSGVVPIAITSIQRQYSFSATQMGGLVSLLDAVVAVAVVGTSFYGHRAHRPRWLGRGMLVFGVGCLVFALPAFVGDRYVATGSSKGELCDAQESTATCVGRAALAMYAIFVLAQVLMGVGMSPIYTLGLTFLDDNVDPAKVPTFLGIFFAGNALGPALGFLLGGVFLGVYTDPRVKPQVDTSSEGWVGAWWIGFLLAAGVTLLVCPALFLVPRHLPNTAWIRSFRRQQTLQPDGMPRSFRRSLAAVFGNPTWLACAVGNVCDVALIAGLGNFLPAFVESSFHLTAAKASFLSGVCLVTGATLGMFLGGSLPRWRKWTPKQVALAMVYFSVINLATFGIFFIQCGDVRLAGVNVPAARIPPPSTPVWEGCDPSCRCEGRSYVPICDSATGVTYFSPCAAGCQSRSAVHGGYTNCTCALDSPAGPGLSQVLVEGKCSDGCHNLPWFLFLLFWAMLSLLINSAPIAMVHMRCVDDEHRSFALGLASFLARIIGATVAPVLVGYILDRSCLLRERDCHGDRGACWEYHNATLALRLFLVTVVIKAVATVAYWIGYRTFPAHCDMPQPQAAPPAGIVYEMDTTSTARGGSAAESKA